jgi:hypothetical protein
MTATASDQQPNGSASVPPWRGQEHRIELRGASYRLRLVRFPAGWLASVDTVEGPTLGYDRSPYLAVSRAVEPIGGGPLDAMAIVAAGQAATHTLHATALRRRSSEGLAAGMGSRIG